MHMTISFTLHINFIPQLLLHLIISPVIGTLNMYICNCQLYEVLDTIFLLDECQGNDQQSDPQLCSQESKWLVERGKIGKDGKEEEVKGVEMERREQKGENGQLLG